MHSDKSIKKHIYDKGKKHVQTLTRIVNDKDNLTINGLGLFAKEGIAQGD